MDERMNWYAEALENDHEIVGPFDSEEEAARWVLDHDAHHEWAICEGIPHEFYTPTEWENS